MSVDIWIATYPEGCKYLDETVESFRAQGIEPKVVCDERPTEVKWNEAIQSCKADYLCIAHHDDIYLTDYVSEMTSYLDAHPEVVAAFCYDYLIDERGNRIGQSPMPDRVGTYDFASLFADTLQHGNILRCETVMYRKALVKEFTFPDKSVCGNAHDTQFWFMLANKHPIGIVRKRLVKYRVHADSDTQKTVAGGINIGHLRALEYAANLRPMDVDFTAHISIAQGLKRALDVEESERVRKRAGDHAELFVCHEPPDNAGTGVVVAERCRRRNKGDGGGLAYYVYPVDGNDIEVVWEHGVPAIRCPKGAFGDLIGQFRPSKIEYHHLLRWPLNILAAPCERKELYFHDSYLWCARFHSFDDKGRVCNEPENGKCSKCSGESAPVLEAKSAYLQKILPSIQRFVANSEYTAEYAKLTLGVECEIEAPAGPELVPLPKMKRVGYFGGFYPVKGVGVLLQAWRTVKGAQLLMFCDVNPEWLNGRSLIGYDNVLVMGAYRRDDLNSLYNLVDLAVVPSLNESYGMVARELRSLGLPVIATKTGGLDGTVPPGDVCALAEAIMDAL